MTLGKKLAKHEKNYAETCKYFAKTINFKVKMGNQ